MNEIFREYLDDFVCIYIDDIVVFSKTLEEHLEHLKIVLDLLRQNKLYGKMSKCKFLKPQMELLGHVVSQDGIQVDPKKVQVVKEWKASKNVHEVRCFLGMCNYYRRFIERYAHIVASITKLLKKKSK